jgi:hypothetical protein
MTVRTKINWRRSRGPPWPADAAASDNRQSPRARWPNFHFFPYHAYAVFLPKGTQGTQGKPRFTRDSRPWARKPRRLFPWAPKGRSRPRALTAACRRTGAPAPAPIRRRPRRFSAPSPSLILIVTS